MEEAAYKPIFVARQPIFDRKGEVWGHELLFRHSGETDTAQFPDPDMATTQVIVDGFSLARSGRSRSGKTLINFPENLLIKESWRALPGETCIVEILETVKPTPEVLKAVAAIREAGYLIAVDDFSGQAELEPLVRCSDIIKVDFLEVSGSALEEIAESLKRQGKILLAEKIEDNEAYETALGLGFSYFQGFHFSRPEVVPGRKIDMSGMTRIDLLRILAREDYDIGQVSKILARDPSLSYRVLAYINSAAFGLRYQVKTIQQALTLLGARPLRHWLLAAVVSDLDPSPLGMEAAYASLVRGRFLESLASASARWQGSADTLFLLGIFSLLDVLFGLPMEELLRSVPLHDEIREALLGGENALSLWLSLSGSIEGADWDSAMEFLARIEADREEAARCHAQAVAWASQIVAAC